jgi:hypothetical protein
MALKLFIEISSQGHDASGIEDPQMYWWANQFGVWYPHDPIEEDDFEEYTKDFLSEVGLVDEELDHLTQEDIDYLLPSDAVKLEYLIEISKKL